MTLLLRQIPQISLGGETPEKGHSLIIPFTISVVPSSRSNSTAKMGSSDVDNAIAAGQVPAGITAAYLKESRDESSIIAILFVCCLTVLVVASRCASRLLVVKFFGCDDALAVVGLVRSTRAA